MDFLEIYIFFDPCLSGMDNELSRFRAFGRFRKIAVKLIFPRGKILSRSKTCYSRKIIIHFLITLTITLF
ncbi:hypothetical protein D3C72_994900 [compost metagenome]